MKIETKTIYKCDFCNKLYQVKSAAEKHESGCFNNPNNKRACLNCNHLTKKEATITVGYHYDGSEQDRKLNLFYCNAKKVFLHTPKNEAKHNVFDLGDDENLPMPKECDLYNTESFSDDSDFFELFKKLNE